MARAPSLLEAALEPARHTKRAKETAEWSELERIVIESTHPKQRGFVLDPGRRLAALVARGGGKTTAGKARLVLRMLRTPKARCVYIATTRAQAEELLWMPLKDLVEKLGIEATFNETKLRCTFQRNGATLRLVGADDKREIEKLRGQPFHEVGVDEAASYDLQLMDHLINRIVEPRLGDYGGCLWLIGTPGHDLRGQFYDVTRQNSKIARRYEDRNSPEFADWGQHRWSVHTWNLEDGAPFVPAMARLWADALLRKEANGWTDSNPVWLREYLGRWAADDTAQVYRYRPQLDDGTPWNQWDPEIDARTGFAKLPPGDWRYVYGIDCGHGDPMAVVVFAFNPAERILRHVYNFERRGMYAKTIAELLLGEDLNHESPGGLFGVTGWPEAIVADTAGLGDALLDELANVYGIRIAPAVKKDKNDSIELFNGDLIDRRVLILKGSSLENQLVELQWAEDQWGKIKENKAQANHSTDAAIYARGAAYHQFKDEAPPAKKPVAPVAAYRQPPDLDDDQVRNEFSSVLGDDGYFNDSWSGN